MKIIYTGLDIIMKNWEMLGDLGLLNAKGFVEVTTRLYDNQELIAAVESGKYGHYDYLALEAGEFPEPGYTGIAIVTLPDNTTDCTFIEDYGMDLFIYVVDGKLHYA